MKDVVHNYYASIERANARDEKEEEKARLELAASDGGPKAGENDKTVKPPMPKKDGKDKALSIAECAVKWKIPYHTFTKYVHSDDKKRRAPGCAPGRNSNVSSENCEFLIQHTIHADRANDGFTQTQVVQNLQQLEPDLSFNQAKNYIHRTLKKKSECRIKRRHVKAQQTTSKRSQCTVAQQFRWFKNYKRAISFLQEKNTGICKKTGKQFGELIEHFILGADETCAIADADGDLRILGEHGKKKHEKNAADYRGSITMYRTGNAAGNNGPTAFVMKGKKRHAGYSDAFLEREGCALGSTITMTENAFMTDAAWETMADSIIRGYRSMSYVKENPTRCSSPRDICLLGTIPSESY